MSTYSRGILNSKLAELELTCFEKFLQIFTCHIECIHLMPSNQFQPQKFNDRGSIFSTFTSVLGTSHGSSYGSFGIFNNTNIFSDFYSSKEPKNQRSLEVDGSRANKCAIL
jgi:hypothetical protein